MAAPEDPFRGTSTREYQGHKKKAHWVAWNCTGRKLASASADQTTRVWDAERHSHGKELELRGHTDGVDQLCWHPSSPDQLATVSADKTVRLWDVRTGKPSACVPSSSENINVAWSPSGQHVVAGNRDDVLTFMDARTLRTMKATKFAYEVNEFAWNKTTSLFFITTGLGTIEVLRYPQLDVQHSLPGHTAGVYCISLDPTGAHFAVGSADSLLSLWDLKEMACIRTFTRHESPVRTLSFAHDGAFLASASEDASIDITHVASGASVRTVQCRDTVNCVAFSPRQHLLAYVGEDAAPDAAAANRGRDAAGPGTVRVIGFPAEKDGRAGS